MDDLISRQTAINEIINLWADKPFGNPALVEIKDCIEKLPSAQPDNRLAKIADLMEGTIAHFDYEDAMDLLYQVKEALDE